MDEAIHRLQQAPASDQLRASMVRATRVVVQQAAVKAVKRQLQAQGRKVAHFAHREIVAMAKDYIAQHPELVIEARETALRWCAEGVFGKQAARSVQHLRDMSKEERPATQVLLLNETHAQNGAVR